MTDRKTIFQADVTAEVGLIVQDKLEKENITEQELAALKEELSHLAEKPIADFGEGAPARLKLISGAIAKCTNRRTTITKICKKGREAALVEQRAWLQNEKELVAIIEQIEGPLRARKMEWESEQEHIALEAAKVVEQRFRDRCAVIEGMHFVFSLAKEAYVLGETEISRVGLHNATPEKWEVILQQARLVYEEEERRLAQVAEIAARAEEERLVAEAAAQEERERAEAARRAEDARIAAAAEQLRLEREELDRRKREMDEVLEKDRTAQLEQLGLRKHPSGLFCYDLAFVDGIEAPLAQHGSERWSVILNTVKEYVDAAKAQEEAQIDVLDNAADRLSFLTDEQASGLFAEEEYPAPIEPTHPDATDKADEEMIKWTTWAQNIRVDAPEFDSEPFRSYKQELLQTLDIMSINVSQQ